MLTSLTEAGRNLPPLRRTLADNSVSKSRPVVGCITPGQFRITTAERNCPPNSGPSITNGLAFGNAEAQLVAATQPATPEPRMTVRSNVTIERSWFEVESLTEICFDAEREKGLI